MSNETNGGNGGNAGNAAGEAPKPVVVKCPRCGCPKTPTKGGTHRTGIYVHRYRVCANQKCKHEFRTRARLITSGPRKGQMSDEEC